MYHVQVCWYDWSTFLLNSYILLELLLLPLAFQITTQVVIVCIHCCVLLTG